MPRIFKGSESTLRLLISKTGDYQALTEIKIKLYTTDIENAIEIIDGIQVCKNIAIITLAPRAFMGMEDGLINYIIDGATEDDVFHTERQSNYMLKSLSYINEDGVASQTMTIESNGEYRVTPNDGLYVNINVNVPDLNGSYDDGFNVGYGQGKTDGEQAGYNSGYDQGQADVAANARVLDVTENGVYRSKFSDKTLLTEPTGIYENGDLFFDYAYLKNIQYNTNIYPMSNTKMEIWWKYDGIKEENEGCIIGCQKWGYINSIFKIAWNFNDNKLLAGINDGKIFIPFIEGWNHIVMSYADGLWLNGVKIGAFSSNITDDMDNKEPICINGYYGNSKMNSDYFGMVKINDVVFIPTENGFLNTSTNELLPIRREGEYTYTSVVPEYDEPTGELYKTINVNVIPKINVQEAGIKFAYGKFAEVPEWADFDGITDMSSMFNECRNLQTIPQIDTSNVTNMEYMFNKCINLQTIPPLNTSKVTNMYYMFNNCSSLQAIPLLNTSNVTNMNYMFSNCSSLQTIPHLNTSKVIDAANMFERCFDLISIPALDFRGLDMDSYSGFFGWYELLKLTDFGGFLNLKSSLTNDKNLKMLPNLTYESCINVLNGLYDFTGNGETPGSNQGQLKVHQNFLDAVGNEISIGTNKGWQITV